MLHKEGRLGSEKCVTVWNRTSDPSKISCRQTSWCFRAQASGSLHGGLALSTEQFFQSFDQRSHF